MTYLIQLVLFVAIGGWIRSANPHIGGPAVGLLTWMAVYSLTMMWTRLGYIFNRWKTPRSHDVQSHIAK